MTTKAEVFARVAPIVAVWLRRLEEADRLEAELSSSTAVTPPAVVDEECSAARPATGRGTAAITPLVPEAPRARVAADNTPEGQLHQGDAVDLAAGSERRAS